ncbi:MAG: SufB/SufD family protein [Planctomycetota bacterium]
MFHNYKSFYLTLFQSPIKIDELTEKHFPDYTLFNNNLNLSIQPSIISSSTRQIVIYNKGKVFEIISPFSPPHLNIVHYSQIKSREFFDTITFSDYIFNYSSYAFANSKCSTPFLIELPPSQSFPLDIFVENNLIDESINITKKTFVGKPNSLYNITEKFIASNVSIFACDYILSDATSMKVLIDLGNIHTPGTSFNFVCVLSKNSRLNFELLGMGSGKIYINIYAIIKGEGAECKITGVSVAKKTDEITCITYINHRAPQNNSFIHINNVLFEKARSFFLGLIRVEKNGFEIDAREINKNLVLSKDARCFSIPKLEIENNNLKCSHSSSISSIDEDILFYLNSRGIPQKVAKKLIATGFLIEPFQNDFYLPIVEKELNEILE